MVDTLADVLIRWGLGVRTESQIGHRPVTDASVTK